MGLENNSRALKKLFTVILLLSLLLSAGITVYAYSVSYVTVNLYASQKYANSSWSTDAAAASAVYGSTSTLSADVVRYYAQGKTTSYGEPQNICYTAAGPGSSNTQGYSLSYTYERVRAVGGASGTNTTGCIGTGKLVN